MIITLSIIVCSMNFNYSHIRFLNNHYNNLICQNRSEF